MAQSILVLVQLNKLLEQTLEAKKALEEERLRFSALKSDLEQQINQKSVELTEAKVALQEAVVRAQQIADEGVSTATTEAREVTAAVQTAVGEAKRAAVQAQDTANQAVAGNLDNLNVESSNHVHIRAHDLWFGGVRNNGVKRALVEQDGNRLNIGWSDDWDVVKVNSDFWIEGVFRTKGGVLPVEGAVNARGYASRNGKYILKVRNDGRLRLEKKDGSLVRI